MKKILVSACLIGTNCKYDGKNNACESVIKLKNRYELIPVCPEVLGGLPTPRIPSEINSGKVLNRIGVDVTKYFAKGAKDALLIAKENNIKYAILKEKSPSCGVNIIYDGTFSKNIVSGMGVFAKMLVRYGIKVYSENEVDKLLKDLEAEK